MHAAALLDRFPHRISTYRVFLVLRAGILACRSELFDPVG